MDQLQSSYICSDCQKDYSKCDWRRIEILEKKCWEFHRCGDCADIERKQKEKELESLSSL